MDGAWLRIDDYTEARLPRILDGLSYHSARRADIAFVELFYAASFHLHPPSTAELLSNDVLGRFQIFGNYEDQSCHRFTGNELFMVRSGYQSSIQTEHG